MCDWTILTLVTAAALIMCQARYYRRASSKYWHMYSLIGRIVVCETLGLPCMEPEQVGKVANELETAGSGAGARCCRTSDA